MDHLFALIPQTPIEHVQSSLQLDYDAARHYADRSFISDEVRALWTTLAVDCDIESRRVAGQGTLSLYIANPGVIDSPECFFIQYPNVPKIIPNGISLIVSVYKIPTLITTSVVEGVMNYTVSCRGSTTTATTFSKAWHATVTPVLRVSAKPTRPGNFLFHRALQDKIKRYLQANIVQFSTAEFKNKIDTFIETPIIPLKKRVKISE